MKTNMKQPVHKLKKPENYKSSGVGAKPSKRELTKQGNRTALIGAAKAVFAGIGFDAANVRDIVRHSGLSVGTFYNYFESKDDLFAIIIEEIIGQVRVRIREARAQAETPYHFIADAYWAFLDECSRDPVMLRIVSRNQVQFRIAIFESKDLKDIFRELERDLKNAINRKLFPKIPAQLATWAIVGTAIEIVVRMDEQKNLSITEISKFLANLFVGGFERLASLEI